MRAAALAAAAAQAPVVYPDRNRFILKISSGAFWVIQGFFIKKKPHSLMNCTALQTPH
jgi:hypothetical protein